MGEEERSSDMILDREIIEGDRHTIDVREDGFLKACRQPRVFSQDK